MSANTAKPAAPELIFSDKLTNGQGPNIAANHAICDGPIIRARVLGGGYPLGEGWSPESEAFALELVRRWNLFPDLLGLAQLIADTRKIHPSLTGDEAERILRIAKATRARADLSPA